MTGTTWTCRNGEAVTLTGDKIEIGCNIQGLIHIDLKRIFCPTGVTRPSSKNKAISCSCRECNLFTGCKIARTRHKPGTNRIRNSRNRKAISGVKGKTCCNCVVLICSQDERICNPAGIATPTREGIASSRRCRKCNLRTIEKTTATIYITSTQGSDGDRNLTLLGSGDRGCALVREKTQSRNPQNCGVRRLPGMQKSNNVRHWRISLGWVTNQEQELNKVGRECIKE